MTKKSLYVGTSKVLSLQRDKASGEMKAVRLSETTMDPTKRGPLQVNIHIVAEADNTLVALLGDAAQLRREFVELTALNVRNPGA